MKDIKARCMNCKYERIVTAQNNYKFATCIKEPYHGKAVWEIEKCPLKTEEVAKLEKELADKTQWLDLYFGQLTNANERIKKYDASEKKLQADRDYWKAEALKHCARLGEIKLLMGRSEG